MAMRYNPKTGQWEWYPDDSAEAESVDGTPVPQVRSQRGVEWQFSGGKVQSGVDWDAEFEEYQKEQEMVKQQEEQQKLVEAEMQRIETERKARDEGKSVEDFLKAQEIRNNGNIFQKAWQGIQDTVNNIGQGTRTHTGEETIKRRMEDEGENYVLNTLAADSELKRLEEEIERAKSSSTSFNDLQKEYYNLPRETREELEDYSRNQTNSGIGKIREALGTRKKDLPKPELYDKYAPIIEAPLETNHFGGIKNPDQVQDTRVMKLEEMANIYRRYLGYMDNNRDILTGVGREFNALNAENKVPFAGAIIDLEKNLQLEDIVKRYSTGEELSEKEMDMVTEVQARMIEERMDLGYAESVGGMLANMPTFMAEFFMTGGLASAGKAATTKVIGKAVEKKSMEAIVKGFARTAIGEFARTSIGFAPHIANKTAEYMLPRWDVIATETGDQAIVQLDEGDSFEEAFKKAGLSQYVESLSESAGLIVDEAMPFLKKAVLGRFLTKYASEAGEELTEESSKTIIKQIMARGGWNGIIGEVFEEEIAEPAQAAIEGRPYYDPITTPEGRERLLTETLGITIFAGIAAVPEITIKNATKLKNKVGSRNVINLRVDESSRGMPDDYQTTIDLKKVGVKQFDDVTAIVHPENTGNTSADISEAIRKNPEAWQPVLDIAKESNSYSDFQTKIESAVQNKTLTLPKELKIGTGEVRYAETGEITTSAMESGQQSIPIEKGQAPFVEIDSAIDSQSAELQQKAQQVLQEKGADSIEYKFAKQKADGFGTGEASGIDNARLNYISKNIKDATQAAQLIKTIEMTTQAANVKSSIDAVLKIRPDVAAIYQTTQPAKFRSASVQPLPLSVMREFADFIDYSRGLWTPRQKFVYEANIRDLATEYGINSEQTTGRLANKLASLLDQNQYGKKNRQGIKDRGRINADKVLDITKYRSAEKLAEVNRQMRSGLRASEVDAIMQLNEKLFGDSDVGIVESILTPDGTKALGRYIDGWIDIANNQMTAKETYYHEAIHKAIDLWLPEARKKAIFDYAKQEYGLEGLAAEERIAEDFIGFVKGQELTIPQRIRQIFTELLNFIKGVAGNTNEINRFYADLIEGRLQQNSPLINITEDLFNTLKSISKFNLSITETQNETQLSEQNQGEQNQEQGQEAAPAITTENIWEIAIDEKKSFGGSLDDGEDTVLDYVEEVRNKTFEESALRTLQELETAQAGFRYSVENDEGFREFRGQSSTFPDWFSLRTRKEIDEFLLKLPDNPLDWNLENNPFKEGTRKAQAWEEFVNRLEKQSFESILEDEREAMEQFLGYKLEDFTAKLASLTGQKQQAPEIPAVVPEVVKVPEPVVITSQQKRQAAQLPVEQQVGNKLRNSRVYEKLYKTIDADLRQQPQYERMNIRENLDRAIDFVESNYLKAKRVALGLENPPANITEIAIRRAMAAKAQLDGDMALYEQLVRSRTLRLTRMGQEIASEKGAVDQDNPEFYLQELVSRRMDIAAKQLPMPASATQKNVIAKIINNQKVSSKEKVNAYIDSEVKSVKKILEAENIKIAKAQEIIDLLTCK